MNFVCQQEPIEQLKLMASIRRQSIIIEGSPGCGKTYLAKQYSEMVGIPDFQVVEPKVDAIRSSIDTCINLNEPIVLCIENLDKGVQSASYALLKFLEEPPACAIVIVTCQNIRLVPDTIVSRSNVVTLGPPIDADLALYAQSKYGPDILHSPLWGCVRTFQDVDTVSAMTSDNYKYFLSLPDVCKFRDSVSNIVWKLGHYEDNSETPIELVIRYIMGYMKTPFVERCGIECIRDLSQGRIAPHAVLSKFAFNVKYCE